MQNFLDHIQYANHLNVTEEKFCYAHCQIICNNT